MLCTVKHSGDQREQNATKLDKAQVGCTKAWEITPLWSEECTEDSQCVSYRCVKPILVCVVVALCNVSRGVFCFCKGSECHHKVSNCSGLRVCSNQLSCAERYCPEKHCEQISHSHQAPADKHIQEQPCNLCSSGTPNRVNSGSTVAYIGSRKDWANQHKGNPLTVSKYREVILDSRIPRITSCERLRDDWVEVSWYVNAIIFFPRHLLLVTVRDQCPVQQFLIYLSQKNKVDHECFRPIEEVQLV